MADTRKIDWNNFERLPGSPRENFQILWRSLVLDVYGGSGALREHYNYPGVEFVFELSEDVTGLGTRGDKIGWQCKYPDIHEEGSSPSTSTRSQAADSLSKLVGKGLKKCFLCVPHDKLLEIDENWIVAQQDKCKIELMWQTNDDIIRLFNLIPNGNLLHGTWFGELVPTYDELKAIYNGSIKPILCRYIPELQVPTGVETTIRAMLFQPDCWNKIKPADYLQRWDETLIDNEIEVAKASLSGIKEKIDTKAAEYRKLRRETEEAEEYFQNDIARLREEEYELNAGIRERVNLKQWKYQSLVAVMADAGVGKTCLAASVADEVKGIRPTGLFLLAKDLRNKDLGSLVANISYRGRKLNGIEEALSILNVAGTAAGCKIPLVIDGLNESESPKEWKDLLARLSSDVQTNYPYVLVVVTLRSGQIAGARQDEGDALAIEETQRRVYLDACIPFHAVENVRVLELPRWGAQGMMWRYFAYYKIRPKFSIVPEILAHPLALSLYCKSLNPNRNKEIEVETPPLTLNAVFKDYIFSAASNIANKDNRIEITKDTVFKDIINLGKKFLESGVRDLQASRIDAGLIQKVMEEGIGLKRMIAASSNEVLEITYDALAGYMMAEAWMESKERDPSLIIRHAMADDILAALVFMYYERCGKRLITEDYPLLSVPTLAEVICAFPEDQVNEKILECVLKNASCSVKIISLWALRCLNHVNEEGQIFNLRLLDSLLCRVSSPAIRDASWGMLIFDNISHVANLLWQDKVPSDDVCLILCKWILSSNIITLRDRSLRILVEYGRRFPEKMFKAVVDALSINDEYVRTGVAKAGYAVAMSLYAERGVEGRESMVVGFANEIAKTSLITNAPHPVWSRQTLDALVRIVELAKLLNPGREYCALNTVRLPYTVVGTPFKRDDEIQDVEITKTKDSLRMDFENYSMTRLVGEHSYQTGSDKYKKALRAVQSRMYQLGFRCEIFKDYDRRVPFEKFLEIDGHKYYLERFGKKYQMIAYEEMATTLSGVVCHYERDGIDSSIDPCLPPEDHEQVPFDIPFMVDDCGGNYKEWLENGKVPDFSTITKATFSDGLGEEWILVNGFLQQTLFGKQETFVFFDGLVVDEKHLGAIKDQIKNHRHYRIREDYELYYLEYPWSTQAIRNPDRPQYQQNAVLPQYIDRYVIEPGNGFDPEVLVREYEHEDYHEGSRESYSRVAYIPEPYVALALKLHPSTGDYNWRNDDGSVVFRYFRKESDRNIEGEDIYYNLVYIRKRELLTYLKARKKAFILCSNGERTLGYEMAKNNINVAKDIGYDYRKAEFTRWYLCLGCDDYKNMADKSYCVLPKYNINYWECMRYKVRHLCRRIKAYLLKPFQSENLGFYLSLLGDDSSLFEKILVRKWSMAQVTYNTLLEQLEVWRKNRERTRLVCFCDANGLAHGWRDKELAAAYRKADAVVADGIIMVKLAKVYGGKLPGRVIGPVLFEKAMEYGVSRGWRHFFCGTNEETLAKLKSNMEAKFPGVKIVGTYAPEYSADPKVPKGVDCDCMWVALGSPKQEKWCAKHLDEFKAVCVLPVGAAFDFHAGTQKPVPQWVHKYGICWLWRMCTGGWRVLKRDLWCVPRAAWILVYEFTRVRVLHRH